MEYRIARGQEHKLVLSSDIYNKDQFMYEAYCEARNALAEIVRYSSEISSRGSDSNMMFESLQNIIAFSGKRGQGKTSTMLSFSQALQKKQVTDAAIEKCSFVVLDPIDPTILEKNQNILALILSRMYGHAETVWSKVSAQSFGYNNRRPTEADKNELLSLFQRCLNGINAIKCKKEAEIKSLNDISVVSDSASLRKNLYDLIHKYLQFVSNANSDQSFMVIQLDDTDFQVTKGHEVLEDLRKFLSIPNVIILMATDLSMLRTVVLQHYITVFRDGIDKDIIDTEKLAKIESKYMDKIVPPVHAIHLPKLEEYVLRYGNSMKFIYEDREKKTNVLFTEIGNGDNNLLSPQELILRYIYRKTGIVFVSDPSSYHGFIPTTLRGLAQLLSLLSELEDIPEVLCSQMEDTSLLIKAERNRAQIAEHNIARFEKYFLNEWVWAKLSHKKAERIQGLAKMAPSERLGYAVAILNEELGKDFQINNEAKKRYTNFIWELEKLNDGKQEQKDAFFILAIQTWLTIANHKTVLRQIKSAIDHYEDGILVFDFSPSVTYLPSIYLSPKFLEDEKNIVLFEKSTPKYSGNIRLISDLLFQKYRDAGKEKTCFSYLHITLLIQSLGHPALKPALNQQTPQRFLYQSQLAIAMLVSNLEVQVRANTSLERGIELGSALETNSEVLSKGLFRNVDRTLKSINCEAEGAPIMADIDFYSIHKFKNESDTYGVATAIPVLTEIDALFDSRPELLDELAHMYAIAMMLGKRLKAVEHKPLIDSFDNQNFYVELSELLARCQSLYCDITHDSASDIFNIHHVELGVTTQDSFKNRFNSRFEKLCTACNIDFKMVKNTAKDYMRK